MSKTTSRGVDGKRTATERGGSGLPKKPRGEVGGPARKVPQGDDELGDEAPCKVVYSREPLHRRSALARMAYSQDKDGRHGSAPVTASLCKDTGRAFAVVDSVFKATNVPPELRLRVMEIARQQAEEFERQGSAVHEDVYNTSHTGQQARADASTGEAEIPATNGEHGPPSAVPTQLPVHHTLHGSIRPTYERRQQVHVHYHFAAPQQPPASSRGTSAAALGGGKAPKSPQVGIYLFTNKRCDSALDRAVDVYERWLNPKDGYVAIKDITRQELALKDKGFRELRTKRRDVFELVRDKGGPRPFLVAEEVQGLRTFRDVEVMAKAHRKKKEEQKS